MSHSQPLDHPQDERAFANQYPNNPPSSGVSTIDSHNRKLLLESLFNKFIARGIEFSNNVLEGHSSGMVDSHDGSVYTGASGTALLLLKRFKVDGDQNHLQMALDLLQPHLKTLRGRTRDYTFLCGDCGPLAASAVVCHHLGSSHWKLRDDCVSRILGMERQVCENPDLPNEMLYGRAGYLFTLLYIQKELGDVIPTQSIINVSNAIIKSGLNLSQRMKSACPLMYVWYDEYYTGAAHGHAGILYILLKVADSIVKNGSNQHDSIHRCPLTYVWHDKHYFGAAHGYAGIIYLLIKVSQKYPEFRSESVLKATVDYMLSLKFTSGNYPSSFESGERDRLVHWCHGAPGFVYMFAAAYEKFQKDQYKKAVLDCAEVVWNRGLLKKGYGICHGVSGNAYTFLCAYKLSGDGKYLHWATQFADWCCGYGQHAWRAPDQPLSMFEGLAGAAYFLLDILVPDEAAFPAFEL